MQKVMQREKNPVFFCSILIIFKSITVALILTLLMNSPKCFSSFCELKDLFSVCICAMTRSLQRIRGLKIQYLLFSAFETKMFCTKGLS